jgi:hypothetical protein
MDILELGALESEKDIVECCRDEISKLGERSDGGDVLEITALPASTQTDISGPDSSDGGDSSSDGDSSLTSEDETV